MTGTSLRALRYGYALNSARRLAHRLGCHHSTIYRNEKRQRITNYMRACIEARPTALAFCRGAEAGRIDREENRG
jgi:IS30 family transposase